MCTLGDYAVAQMHPKGLRYQRGGLDVPTVVTRWLRCVEGA
jgi:hypothetical protein